MSDCCGGPSRRAVLAALALGPAWAWADPEAGHAAVVSSRRLGGAGPVPSDAELVTVTATSITVRWTTVDPAQLDALGRPTPLPADTSLTVTDLRGRVVGEVSRDDATATHLATVEGLSPGRTYAYQARSAGRLATPRLLTGLIDRRVASATSAADLLEALDPAHSVNASPGTVTTLMPPTGPVVVTLALTNDLHVGETLSGALSGGPRPVTQVPGSPPYPVVMLSALTADLAGVDALLVGGDLTAEAALDDARESLRLLTSYGPQAHGGPIERGSWLAVRGNHDRVHGDDDTVGRIFDLPRQQLSTATINGVRIIGLDTCGDGAGGVLARAQLADLSTELARDPDRPTVVFGHHPVTAAAASATLGGAAFDLDPAAGRALEAAYAKAPGVFFHHSGHTHRYRLTRSPLATRVGFLEVGAIKEYPGCWTKLQVHTDGYVVTTHAVPSPDALAWVSRSGTQFAGYYPSYVLGTTATRNHVVMRDLSGVTRSSSHHVAESLGAAGIVVASAALATVTARHRGQQAS